MPPLSSQLKKAFLLILTSLLLRTAGNPGVCTLSLIHIYFIMALPDGYDTMVGEGGSTLSGGEKQRISIARAILKDAPVLLLDEATSSLDPENEVEVQQAIEELVKDRTVVMIAHKLKTIAGADQIIVLDQGEVKEVGTHKALMNNHGLYRHLWDIQQTTAGWQIN